MAILDFVYFKLKIMDKYENYWKNYSDFFTRG